jgi:predicted alpha/beta-fold hydrolase
MELCLLEAATSTSNQVDLSWKHVHVICHHKTEQRWRRLYSIALLEVLDLTIHNSLFVYKMLIRKLRTWYHRGYYVDLG